MQTDQQDECRILIHAPTGRDGSLASEVLASAQIPSLVCHDMAQLCGEYRRAGAGALLLAIEGLTSEHLDYLRQMLDHQEAWSDLPVLILSVAGSMPANVEAGVHALGNVMLLDRPLRIPTLLSAARTALRARERQYQIRQHLEESALAAAAVRDSETRYRLLAELSPDPMFVEQDGVLVYGNAATGVLLGRTVSSLIGRPASEFIANLPEGGLKSLSNKDPAEFSWTCAHGGRRVVEMAVTQLPWSGRLAVQVIGRDVTARKVVEEELRIASQAKDEFLGLVSHELRTPLTVLLPLSRSLEREAATLGVKEEVATLLVHNAERLHSIVENMLTLARLNRAELATEPLLLQRFLPPIAQDHLKRHPGRRLTVEVPADLPIVEAQPSWLRQVVENLLSNAEKYSPGQGEVILTVAEEDGAVCVRVLDEGEGLADDEQESLFDPFFRSRRRDHDQKPGVGLGLAVCKRLIELQGGEIWAKQRPGAGSEFAFTIPLVPAGSPATG